MHKHNYNLLINNNLHVFMFYHWRRINYRINRKSECQKYRILKEEILI